MSGTHNIKAANFCHFAHETRRHHFLVHFSITSLNIRNNNVFAVHSSVTFPLPFIIERILHCQSSKIRKSSFGCIAILHSRRLVLAFFGSRLLLVLSLGVVGNLYRKTLLKNMSVH